MDIAIAIFAKNPDLSPVKTRLAADIGEAKAQAFYRLCLQAVQELVQEMVATSSHKITPYWALAEQQSCALLEWQCFETLWTGTGGLGERMHHVYSSLLKRHDAVLMIGSDSPALPIAYLASTADLLAKDGSKVVIGPAMDGGFYLFGGRCKVMREIWVDTQYSHSNTLQFFVGKLQHYGIRAVFLPPHFDVDTGHDLVVLREFLCGTVDGRAGKERICQFLLDG